MRVPEIDNLIRKEWFIELKVLGNAFLEMLLDCFRSDLKTTLNKKFNGQRPEGQYSE